jgi:hypothetical protein
MRIGQVSNTLDDSNFTVIAGGEHLSLALTSAEKIVGWGGDFGKVLSGISGVNDGNDFTAIATTAAATYALTAEP